ncbi:MAG: 16S rRNA processing protein RimM [Candidatus Eremiobacteraeota bacterium]|nr:16S rRNA processing protein RimM [Candidatus Eremiobacteraeota bacterium]
MEGHGDKRTGNTTVRIARLVKPHGIKGEIRALLDTDFPERLKKGLEVIVTFPGSDKKPVKTRIRASRPFKKGIIISLAGIDDRNSAEELRGAYLEIPEEDIHPQAEGSFYIHQLMGLRVKSLQGNYLGIIEEVIRTPANDVYVSRLREKEFLIPALRKVVKSVNLSAGIMLVDQDGSW